MDETTKAISAFNPAGRDSDSIRRLYRRQLTETLVRPGSMVVVDELGQHCLQVLSAEDQQVVKRSSRGGARERSTSTTAPPQEVTQVRVMR